MKRVERAAKTKSKAKSKPRATKSAGLGRKGPSPRKARAALLSGGNPQIAKDAGDAPVPATSPFHVFTRYVKVTLFRGSALRPVPPGASKHKDVRYLDIHEGAELDEAQLAKWIKQAAAIPGWMAGGPS